MHRQWYRQHKLIKSEWIAIHYFIMEDIADRVGLEYYLIVRCEFISMCTPQIVWDYILYIYNVNNKKKNEKWSCEVYRYHRRLQSVYRSHQLLDKLPSTSWMGVFFHYFQYICSNKYSIRMLYITYFFSVAMWPLCQTFPLKVKWHLCFGGPFSMTPNI